LSSSVNPARPPSSSTGSTSLDSGISTVSSSVQGGSPVLEGQEPFQPVPTNTNIDSQSLALALVAQDQPSIPEKQLVLEGTFGFSDKGSRATTHQISGAVGDKILGCVYDLRSLLVINEGGDRVDLSKIDVAVFFCGYGFALRGLSAAMRSNNGQEQPVSHIAVQTAGITPQGTNPRAQD
jgi:hypothetical protein